jgi:hypothetical protein
MDHDDFDDVYSSHRNEEVGSPDGRRESHAGTAQVGLNADPLDTAGLDGATLECTVTLPLKENDGTKDTYVSYLVTTTVCVPCGNRLSADSSRQISPHLQNQLPPYADASQISSSSTRCSVKNIHNAPSLLSQTSTT